MKETKVKKDQIPINFSFISNKSFNNYIVGKDNYTIETLTKLSDVLPATIVFLIGKKSSGKSHLCSAVRAFPNKSISFINENNIKDIDFVKILVNDLLIIDNIDKIIPKYNIEVKLFSVINDFILAKKGILVTSTVPLDKIKFKLLDLISRLKWDQVITIPELSDKDKIKVLQKNAQERGWTIPDNVCDYIMSHYKRDLFFLCNCIKYIDEASLSLKKKVTIPFIKKIIEYK
tara:strand:- start:660 stop:1355 length:696 start_codon:yes stop_codon:yes gene_type:complete